tara:strand:+ start:361 stop:969 length:609 start_codon:yes stop_codon:yes gene_type:complete
MKIFSRKIYLSLCIVITSIQISASDLSAHEYASKVHKEIIEIIQTKDDLFIEDPEKFTQEISDAFSPIVDFKRIARNVMGKYYKNASEVQRDEFSKAFESSLLDTYSGTLVEFKDEKIIVIPPNSPEKYKDKAKVKIEIITSSQSYPGTYSMYLDKEGKWKIINIVVNGINLGKTFRSQFYSLMKKNEENIDLVIDQWIASV